MGEMKADNTWKIYLDTPDIARTVTETRRREARFSLPSCPSPIWVTSSC